MAVKWSKEHWYGADTYSCEQDGLIVCLHKYQANHHSKCTVSILCDDKKLLYQKGFCIDNSKDDTDKAKEKALEIAEAYLKKQADRWVSRYEKVCKMRSEL